MVATRALVGHLGVGQSEPIVEEHLPQPRQRLLERLSRSCAVGGEVHIASLCWTVMRISTEPSSGGCSLSCATCTPSRTRIATRSPKA